MKDNTHPAYEFVLFEDSQTQDQFLIRSTLKTKDRGIYKADGKEYPRLAGSPTSKTHPFFIGTTMHLDTEGRISKFANKYARKAEEIKAANEKQEVAAKEKAKAKKKK